MNFKLKNLLMIAATALVGVAIARTLANRANIQFVNQLLDRGL